MLENKFVPHEKYEGGGSGAASWHFEVRSLRPPKTKSHEVNPEKCRDWNKPSSFFCIALCTSSTPVIIVKVDGFSGISHYCKNFTRSPVTFGVWHKPYIDHHHQGKTWSRRRALFGILSMVCWLWTQILHCRLSSRSLKLFGRRLSAPRAVNVDSRFREIK